MAVNAVCLHELVENGPSGTFKRLERCSKVDSCGTRLWRSVQPTQSVGLEEGLQQAPGGAADTLRWAPGGPGPDIGYVSLPMPSPRAAARGARLLVRALLLRAIVARACTVHEDMLGPLWFAGAPYRSGGVVCAPGSSADAVLTVSGYVRSAGCEGAVPFAVLDVWQASSDADGALYYGCAACTGDNARHAHGEYYCRGKVEADGAGFFTFQTVMPGLYDARPVAHVHVRVLEAGETGPAHVTQLYFASDQGSASMPSAVRMVVDSSNRATIDIATPFADPRADPALVSAIDPARGCDVSAYYAPADLTAAGAPLQAALHALVSTPHTVVSARGGTQGRASKDTM